jgi:hypothetical protein
MSHHEYSRQVFITKYIIKSLIERISVAVMIYILILEVLGLNLARDIGYPEVGPRFSQSLHATVWIVSQNWSPPFPSTSFPIHHTSITVSFIAI